MQGRSASRASQLARELRERDVTSARARLAIPDAKASVAGGLLGAAGRRLSWWPRAARGRRARVPSPAPR
jgi:hypothetical protein